jgi:porin
MHSGGYAIYGIVDQMVWRPKDACGDCGPGVFAQVMGAPSQFNLSNLFIEAGLNWKGVFKGRDNDTLGLGVSYVGISPAAQAFSSDVIAFTGKGTRYAGSETVIEATYAYKANDWFALQPDLQYVINPNGGIPTPSNPRPLKNALVAGVRATISF